MVRDSVEARLCDRCEADTNHEVEYTRYDSAHAEEVARCRDCGRASVNKFAEGEES